MGIKGNISFDAKKKPTKFENKNLLCIQNGTVFRRRTTAIEILILCDSILKEIKYKTLLSWETLCISEKYMSHFAYACKMRDRLNLVLENIEYLWFYWTFCILIFEYGLKLHKLSNHTLVMLQKWLEIH